MKVTKFIFAFAAILLFSSCIFNKETKVEINPESKSLRSENLDFIFNTNSVGKITITMERSEWNQMLKNFAYFYENENCVKFTQFEYEKNGKKWILDKGGGIRLRGNTSRFAPQGKDSPVDQTGHHKMNEDWSKDYYNYARYCSDNDYRQSHFKVDFEEFLEEGDEQKLAGCMKGVALKRMDGSCTKEIFCYDLFHRYGIWTAPRASHTRVFFNFIEDNGSVTKVNYGVYEMFEEVNKQSLKARDKDENSAKNAWKNSKGNLWKCAGGDLTNANATMFPENICITAFDENGNPIDYIKEKPTYDLKTNKDDLASAETEFRQFIRELNMLPNVRSVDDTDSINVIKEFYERWMDVEFFLKTYAVNILVGMDDDYWSNANNYYLYFTDTPANGRKVYFIPFDYDNTIGASIMQDNGVRGIEQNPLDWGRGKNRPLMDKLLQVPEYRKLFKEKLIEVSAPDSEWNYEKCSKRWYDYWNMVDPYLWSPDLSDHVCTKGHWDNVYCPGGYSLVNKWNNIYDYTRKCFMQYLTAPGAKIKFDLNGGNIDGNTEPVEIEIPEIFTSLSSLIQTPKKQNAFFMGWTKTKDGNDYKNNTSESVLFARWKYSWEIKDLYIYELEQGMTGYDPAYEGIQIRFLNVPEFIEDGGQARVRQIFINDVKVSDESWRGEAMRANVWRFPYTEKNKNYEIYVKYLKSDYWSELVSSNKINIKAKSGIGKFAVESPVIFYSVADNIITYEPEPKIYVAGKQIDKTYNPGSYKLSFHDSQWHYSFSPSIKLYYPASFNILDWVKTNDASNIQKALENSFEHSMYYSVYSGSELYGSYRLDINLSGSLFNLTME